MATTLSFQGVLYRSNVFDRYPIRKIGGTSRDSYKEFSCTVDLSTNPIITYPLAVPIQDITTIKFVMINVIGGSAVIRFVKNGAYTSSPSTIQITGETLTGTVDGTNNTFTFAFTPVTSTERIYVNGVRQVGTYTMSSGTVLFNVGAVPPLGATVISDYYYTTALEPVPLTTQNLDLTVSGTILMSEIDINQLFIMNAPNGAIVEVIGSGQ